MIAYSLQHLFNPQLLSSPQRRRRGYQLQIHKYRPSLKSETERKEAEAKQAFLEVYPQGVKEIPTSGEDLLYGLHAIELSLQELQRNYPSIAAMRVPTSWELRREVTVHAEYSNIMTEPKLRDLTNNNFFSFDQLMLIIGLWMWRNHYRPVRLGVLRDTPGSPRYQLLELDPSIEQMLASIFSLHQDGQPKTQGAPITLFIHHQGIYFSGLHPVASALPPLLPVPARRASTPMSITDLLPSPTSEIGWDEDAEKEEEKQA